MSLKVAYLPYYHFAYSSRQQDTASNYTAA